MLGVPGPARNLLTWWSQPWAAGAVACGLALLAGALRAAGSDSFCLDDAYIHLAYAKSLWLGDGLSYNPGAHETGFPSPRWVLVLAPLATLESHVAAVRALGIGLHALLALGAVQLTRRLCGASDEAPDLRAALAGVLLAFDPWLTFSAVSGMEVTLTALCLVWTCRLSLGGKHVAAGALGFACVWCRPESLFFLGPWCGLRFVYERRWQVLVPALGALFALGVWCAYCQLVSGYPWPNTYYKKRGFDLLLGLLYFVLHVLPEQAWAMSAVGVVLAYVAARTRPAVRWVVLAWVVSVLLTAATRTLNLGLLFYNSRYFAICAPLPLIAAACAWPQRARWAALSVGLWLVAVGVLGVRSSALQASQERDIGLLHVEPARWLATRLPADARLAAEGAGALRYYLPRTQRVLDVNGLNDRRVAHAPTPQAALCEVLRSKPTHVALPDEHIAGFQQTLRLSLAKTATAPDYSISVRRSVRHVFIARVLGATDLGQRLCALPWAVSARTDRGAP